MKEFSVGFALVMLLQILRPRKFEVKGLFGIALFSIGCYGVGTLILRLIP